MCANNRLYGPPPELHPGFLERGFLLVRLLGDGGGVVVADVRVEGGDEHEARAHEIVDAVEVGLDAPHAVICERYRRLGEKFDALEVRRERRSFLSTKRKVGEVNNERVCFSPRRGAFTTSGVSSLSTREREGEGERKRVCTFDASWEDEEEKEINGTCTV